MSKSARSKSVLSRIAFEAIENRLMLTGVPGTPDSSFGVNGVVELDVAVLDEEFQTAKVMVAQDDGNILIAGENSYGVVHGVCITRTDKDGNIDQDFAAYGTFTLDVCLMDTNNNIYGLEYVTSLAVDSTTGNIFLGGYCDLGGFVVALTPSGAPNTDFAPDGVLWPSMDSVTALTCDSGKVFIAGTTFGNNSSDIALAKLSEADGQSDSLFNEGSMAVYTLDDSTEQVNSILIQKDGNIALGGLSVNDSTYVSSWLIGQLDETGALIASFGDQGFILDANTEYTEDDAINTLIEIGDDNIGYSIVAGGGWTNAGQVNCAVVVISETNGALGDKTLFNASHHSNVNKLAKDKDGNIIVAGTAYDDPANQSNPGFKWGDVLVTRLNSNLVLDASFGIHTSGKDFNEDVDGVVYPVAINEESLGVSIQNTGRIVIGTNAYFWKMSLFGFVGSDEVIPTNVAPVVDALANQTVNEGDTVSLSGTFTDEVASTCTLAWSVLADNDQIIENGAGANFSFVPTDNGVYTVTFTVTDAGGLSSSAVATITVDNVAPTASLTGPASAALFTTTSYAVSFADPGAADTQTIAWSITDSSDTIVASGSTAAIDFTPAATGDYVISATVTDDDGGSSTASLSVNVSPVAVVNGELIASAGTASNTVVLTSSAGQISLRLDGSTYSFSGITHITLNCGAGNDIVLINPFLGVSVDVFGGDGADILIAGSGGDMILGGAGSDLLMGNSGADILVGGDGNDLISGGNGNDLIIGGEGADLLLGNADQDILIAGNTAFDANPAALKAILAEWSGSNTYAQRVNNIINGSGTATRANGGYFFTPDVTVFDDAARDSLAGNSGTDWFIFNADAGIRDLLIDRSYAESAFDVDVNI